MYAILVFLALSAPQAPTPPQAPPVCKLYATAQAPPVQAIPDCGCSAGGCDCGPSCACAPGRSCAADCPCGARTKGPTRPAPAGEGWQWTEDEGGYWWRYRAKQSFCPCGANCPSPTCAGGTSCSCAAGAIASQPTIPELAGTAYRLKPAPIVWHPATPAPVVYQAATTFHALAPAWRPTSPVVTSYALPVTYPLAPALTPTFAPAIRAAPSGGSCPGGR